jgi:hypothetical protein
LSRPAGREQVCLSATRQNFGAHITPQIDIGCPAISDSSDPSVELNIRTNASICALFPAMFNSIASSVFSIELNSWKNALPEGYPEGWSRHEPDSALLRQF